jgi:hypothetical protein
MLAPNQHVGSVGLRFRRDGQQSEVMPSSNPSLDEKSPSTQRAFRRGFEKGITVLSIAVERRANLKHTSQY